MYPKQNDLFKQLVNRHDSALPQKVITVQRLKIHTDGISVG